MTISFIDKTIAKYVTLFHSKMFPTKLGFTSQFLRIISQNWIRPSVNDFVEYIINPTKLINI